MRFSGFSKDRKAKNSQNDDDSSEANAPATSQVQVKKILCVKCGKVFSEPVKLTVKGKGSSDEYSACPHCFSRISSFYTEEKSNTAEESVDEPEPVSEDLGTDSEETEVTEETEQAEGETEEPASVAEVAEPGGCACGHSVGYLKTLRKGTPTPDECFTCPSLIKCKY